MYDYLSSDLISAINNNADLSVLKFLVARRAPVNYVDVTGDSPLTAAIKNKAGISVLTFLLDSGADIKMLDHDHLNPLSVAIKYSADIRVLKFLLDRGASLTYHGISLDELLPLMVALKYKSDARVVALLFDHGANPDCRDAQGRYPLTFAIQNQVDFSVLDVLLRYGADINLCFHDGIGRQCPLLYALRCKADLSMVRYLLDHGANSNPGERCGLLHAAVRYGADVDTINLLLDHEADISHLEDNIPLLTAAIVYMADMSVINLLLSHELDPNQVEGENLSPLTAAIVHRPKIDVLTLLLDQGADPNQLDGHGLHPLVVAVECKTDESVLTLLLDHGAQVNCIDDPSQSPLSAAIRCEAAVSVLTVLLKNGADWMALDEGQLDGLVCTLSSRNEMQAVLHFIEDKIKDNTIVMCDFPSLTTAILAKTDSRTVARIVNQGADVNETSWSGYTPLISALETGADWGMIVLLLQHGADWTQLKKNHNDLISVVTSNGENNELVCFMQEKPPVQDAGADEFPLLTSAVMSKADEKTVALLIEKGANVNEAGWSGFTPMYAAVKIAADPGTLILLLQYGADWTKLKEDELSKLIAAVDNVNKVPELVKFMREKADHPGMSNGGFPRLTTAILAGAGSGAVSRIFSEGAQVDEESWSDFTPWTAAMKTNAEQAIFNLLVEHGEMNHRDRQGDIPLHKAITLRNYGYIHALVDGGSDINLKNNAGKSCVDVVMGISDPKQRQTLNAAIHRKPPPAMSPGDWYQELFQKGRDLIQLINDQPELDHSAKEDYTYLPVQKVSRKQTEDALVNKEEIYQMSSRPRGRAIIINIREFGQNESKTRKGSEYDVTRLANLFTQLGFQVERWDNKKQCTKQEQLKDIQCFLRVPCSTYSGSQKASHCILFRKYMYQEKLKVLKTRISAEKNHPDHKGADAFVLVIMSHGDNCGNLKTSDEKVLNTDNDIVKPFDGENWPVMKGKPKLFFIQACRGAEKYYSDDSDSLDPSKARPKEIHPKADLIKIYSTYEGYAAMRVPGFTKDPPAIKGAWFIKEFVLVCEMFAHVDHIGDLVTKANSLLQRRKAVLEGILQIAQMDTSLRKKLFFFPGYPDDCAS